MKRTILIFTMLVGCAVDTGEVRQGTRCRTCEGDDSPIGNGTYLDPNSTEAAAARDATIRHYGQQAGNITFDCWIGSSGVACCLFNDDPEHALCCTIWEDGVITCDSY